jgi:hypothetical protein
MAMTELLSVALSRHIVLNALKIALVVGTLLNLINQGDNLLHADGISWFHLLLNYLVPYSVASYSAAKNEIEQKETHDEPAQPG